MQRGEGGDDGMTLVEIVIAMAIVTVGLLGMLSEVVSYIREQSTQRAHATAMRFATSALEDARQQKSAALTPGTQSVTKTGPNGVSYTTTTTVQQCDPSVQSSCVAPASGGAAVSRVLVSVSWNDGHGGHQLNLDSATTDTRTQTLSSSTGNLVTNATGTNGTTVTAGTLSLSPTSVTVNSSGTPGSDVTATLTVVGLTQGTSIPLTWTDDNGAHQTTMTSNDGKTWTATVSKSSITRKVSSGSKTVVFSSTIPGVDAPVSATLTVVPQPAFNGSCSVVAAPIVTLLRNTTVPEILTCNTVGLSNSDKVQAVYASGSGTATASMTSSDGSTWTVTLATGTPMAASGSTENFTFTLTRVSDGYTQSQSLSVGLT